MSLSNVIKSSTYVPIDDKRMIESHIQALLALQQTAAAAETISSPEADEAVLEAKELSRQILDDAEAEAEARIRQAQEEAEAIREQAQSDIERWWQDKRQHDEEHVSKSRDEGYQQGYEAGRSEAEQAVRAQYADYIAEARSVLEQAYEIKKRIIGEAEPFLIEISCAIAEKIIDRELTMTQEYGIELIKNTLMRKREQGTVVLCVSPRQFQHIQNAREELLLALDSQAELQILPDASIQDYGCVVRTAFGSIDGRIDTQLQEIKALLQQIATEDEGAAEDG